MNMRILCSLVVSLAVFAITPILPAQQESKESKADAKNKKVEKTDEEWAKILTRGQFMVTRQKATEPAFSGKYVNNHAKGIYHCVCCDADLFNSRTKFESGTGWPSFYKPVDASALATEMDYKTEEERVEVMCSRCGAHLGHVFTDGPPPTGLRYCINSLSLKFVKDTNSATTSKKDAAKAKSKAKAKTKGKPSAEPKSRTEDDEAPKKDAEEPATP